MGQSTDGLLIYGVALPEEVVLPWEHNEEGEWWLKESGYVPTFQPFDGKGEYREGVDKDDPRVNAYFDERNAWRKSHPLPVAIHTHCSCEYPMFIVAPHDCEITASRGDPELDVLPQMEILFKTDILVRQEKARVFLKKYLDPLNDEPPSELEFSWILASLWC